MAKKKTKRKVAKKAPKRNGVKKAPKRKVVKKAPKRKVAKKAPKRKVAKKAPKRKVAKKAPKRKVAKKAPKRKVAKKASKKPRKPVTVPQSVERKKRGKRKAKPTPKKRYKPSKAHREKRRAIMAEARKRQAFLEDLLGTTCSYSDFNCEVQSFIEADGTVDTELIIYDPPHPLDDTLRELDLTISWNELGGYWLSIVFWIIATSRDMAEQYEVPLRGKFPITTHWTKNPLVGFATSRFIVLEQIQAAQMNIVRMGVRLAWTPSGQSPSFK